MLGLHVKKNSEKQNPEIVVLNSKSQHNRQTNKQTKQGSNPEQKKNPVLQTQFIATFNHSAHSRHTVLGFEDLPQFDCSSRNIMNVF